MEDTLRGTSVSRTSRSLRVLILILMEDTLRVALVKKAEVVSSEVLTLILLEDTLRVSLCRWYDSWMRLSLNPYSNGRYSTRTFERQQIVRRQMVLILILMEDTLWVHPCYVEGDKQQGLNPYSNGRYSMRWRLCIISCCSCCRS